jgi:hypothetical protein
MFFQKRFNIISLFTYYDGIVNMNYMTGAASRARTFVENSLSFYHFSFDQCNVHLQTLVTPWNLIMLIFLRNKMTIICLLFILFHLYCCW